jgi:hypothetical protein
VTFYNAETEDSDKETAITQVVDRLVEYLRTIQKESQQMGERWVI